MEIEVVCDDEYGGEAYRKLFNDIIGDIGKSSMFVQAKLVLKPDVPLFIFSVILKNKPGVKIMADAATFREEGDDLHLSIFNEKYAPEILSILWKKYGRQNIEQQTRFDLVAHGCKEADIRDLVISTGEESIKEVMGAFWRSLPEGIRVRKSLVDGKVISIVATEEIMKPELLNEGIKIHSEMVEIGKRVTDV